MTFSPVVTRPKRTTAMALAPVPKVLDLILETAAIFKKSLASTRREREREAHRTAEGGGELKRRKRERGREKHIEQRKGSIKRGSI